MITLGIAISQITIANGETEPFSVRVPGEGSEEEGKVPVYIYDADPDNPVDVPADIVAQAEAQVQESTSE